MKFCQPHWDALRTAIDARGMSHLTATSGEIAAQNAVLELEGRSREAMFDPLMAAHNLILSRALEEVGLMLLIGDYCAVCEMLRVLPPIPEGHRYATNLSFMIDGPADCVLAGATERGLMNGPPTGTAS